MKLTRPKIIETLKQYASKPLRGAIDQLRDQDITITNSLGEAIIRKPNTEDWARIKAKEISKVTQPLTFTLNGIRIRRLAKPEYRDGKLYCWIKATLVSTGEDIPVENPIIFVNPPINVPDGTYRQEVINGETVDVENYKDDPLEALKIILVDAVYSLNQ